VEKYAGNRNAPIKSSGIYGHIGKNQHPVVFGNPGFRVALAIASLPGMTIKCCRKVRFQNTDRLMQLDSECFDERSMHGKIPAISKSFPLVLSLSKDS
jgi:hypothetical protein